MWSHKYMLVKKARGSFRPQTSTVIQAAAVPLEREQTRESEKVRDRGRGRE